jgi:hypothetical protein
VFLPFACQAEPDKTHNIYLDRADHEEYNGSTENRLMNGIIKSENSDRVPSLSLPPFGCERR